MSAQASKDATAAKASFQRSCEACEKNYFSENAYLNHLGSQKHKARAAMAASEKRTETASIISSTISLGAPNEIIAPENTHDPEVEAEFSKVVEGVKNTSMEENSPVSRRPSRPHHSRQEQKPDHPISPSDMESESSDAPETSEASKPMPIGRCLFCNYDSPSLDLNISHMTKFHGMFIPEQSYLSDMTGLITYLQEKVSENNECLFCHKLKYSTEAIQTHMRDKGHCMIAFDKEEELLEIGQFYDFRSTYSDGDWESDSDDAEQAPSRKAGTKLGAAHEAASSNNDDDQDGEGWETDSDAESIDSDGLTAVHVDRVRTHVKRPKHLASDGFHAHSRHAAYTLDNELFLPSGKTAGHRSFNRYWRQNLHSYPAASERGSQRRLPAPEQALARLLFPNLPKNYKLPRSDMQLLKPALELLGEDDLMSMDDQQRRAARVAGDRGREEGMAVERVARRAEVARERLNELSPQQRAALETVRKRVQVGPAKGPERKADQVKWRTEKAQNKQKYFRDDNYGIRR